MIQRWRANVGDDAINEHESNKQGLKCLKFDEKNDFVNMGNNKIKKVNHLTVTEEPSNKYVDHCESGKLFSFIILIRMPAVSEQCKVS